MSAGAATDVVVVGGGAVGCACAHALAARGARVTLLERSELAAGASGRNHGLLLTLSDPVLDPLRERSTRLYEELVTRAPLDLRLDPGPVGFLVVAGDDDREREAAREEAEGVAARGVAVERLEGRALREAEPALGPAATEAWRLDDGRRVDPTGLTVSLALLAQGRGAEVRRHLAARAVAPSPGSGVRVVTDEGAVHAGAVVIAAGPWSPALLRPLGIHLAVAESRGWIVHLGPAEVLPRHLVEGAGWHVVGGEEAMPRTVGQDLDLGFPHAHVGALLHPTPEGTLLAGGSRQAVVASEPEDPDVPRAIAREAVRWLPAMASAPVLSAWWGIRPMTPDGRPLVGQVEEGIFVATGHGSSGVMLAGATGEQVAAQVLGEPPPFDPSPLDPLRFGARPVARAVEAEGP